MVVAIRNFGMLKMPLEFKTPKGIFVLFILMILFGSSFSQVNILDSIRNSFKNTPVPFGDFSSHYTFIGGINSPVLNIKAGADFGSKFSMGIGYAYLKNPFPIDKSITSSTGQPVNVNAFLNFGYFNCFANYVFHSTQHWEFSVPLSLGIGGAHIDYNYNNKHYVERRKLVLLYEPVVSGVYKILPWFAVGGDVGYRFMYIRHKSINENFNSPAYSIKTVIYVWRLYKIVHSRIPIFTK